MQRTTPRFRGVVLFLAAVLLTGAAGWAQVSRAIVKRSENRPLASLAEAARAAVPQYRPGPVEIPNFRGESRSQDTGFEGPDPLVRDLPGLAPTALLSSFNGADNDDNQAVVGFRVSPPDTNGDVGPNHYVQMINLVTTVFDKSGAIVPGGGPFASNAFWAGAGGNCEPFDQGDPVALYDETNDRWLVSQFAFDGGFTTFSQCVAISQSGNPLGGYNRYEYSFDGIGLPDYPKHGIVSESITMTANIFSPPFFFFSGTFLGAMDKAAMYAGQPATLVGFLVQGNEFGFLPGDLDDAAGSAGFVSALFGDVQSSNRRGTFNIWEIDVDWNNPVGASASRIARVRVSPFDPDLCTASREACVPQQGGPDLEAISDRLMHRLQLRDFGNHLTMMASHTVDVGGGRAGIRWYELRRGNNGRWSAFQEGTYAPNDDFHRWMPSIAINAAGDIGLGYLRSSATSFVSVALAGQTANNSGSGNLNSSETVCQAGTAAQTGTARSGDYSATSVDPSTGSFWHTNEFVRVATSSVPWDTKVCQFQPVP